MKLRDWIILVVCFVVAAGLFTAAGMQLDSINKQREDMNLVIDTPENIPPSLAFATVATGAFRGLLVDALWIRADRLKDEGQFFDARQLAEWITILQPRFASVWEFQAWNMAYNISVAIPATQPEQRWSWVKNGYELLRDQAIDKYKLTNISIYRELARIFQHKIGGVSDDVHKYYKIQLAMGMEPLLGPADNQFFDKLAEAPIQWTQIIEDPNVSAFVDALRAADPNFADQGSFVDNYLSLRQNSSRYAPAAGQVVDAFRGSRALEKFDVFAKASELRKTWKLDPVLMRELNQTYGPVPFDDPNTHLPLDWRLADSHAIYWAVKGLRIAAEKENRKLEMNETNTDRIVAHCLQDLFRNGKMYIYDVPVQVTPDDPTAEPETRIVKDVFLRPDLRYFDVYNKSTLNIIEKYKEAQGGVDESIANGHRNMLRNAVLLFYQAGHKRQAQKIYDQMRKLYPMPEFKNPSVESFAVQRFREEIKDLVINDAKEMIIMMLRESYFRYAVRDDDEAFARENLVKELWDYYWQKYNDENRIDLPKLSVLRYLALLDFLNDQQYPINLRGGLLARMKVERPQLFEQLLKAEETKNNQQTQESSN
jgi:hypothetical protein